MSALRMVARAPEAVHRSDALFPRVVLGVDFGTASLAAARWATAHAAVNTNAILAHVVPSPDDVPDVDDHELMRDESLRLMTPALRGGLGGFAATLDASHTRGVLRVGSPSRWLSTIANDAEASLIVLGRRGDANRNRVGEPNVIERTARRTGAAVLVVPEGALHAPARILAAVDESSFASRVLAIAQRLARLHEVPLVVLHVLSPAVGAYERVIRTARHFVERGKRLVEGRPEAPRSLPANTARWLTELGDSHVVLGRDRTEVAIGDPAREIAAAAAAVPGTVVVAGMRGSDEAPPGSIGSVVRELLTRAPVPVLAVNGV